MEIYYNSLKKWKKLEIKIDRGREVFVVFYVELYCFYERTCGY